MANFVDGMSRNSGDALEQIGPTPASLEQDQHPTSLWLSAYGGAGGVNPSASEQADTRVAAQTGTEQTDRDAGKLNAKPQDSRPAKMTPEARSAIAFEPKGAVDGTFTEGKHTVSKGVFIARGSAEVSAEGSATVHGFDKAYIKGKDNATVYVSDSAIGQVNGNATIYARGNGEAYGFDQTTVHAFDRVEVHAHDKPKVFVHDNVNAFVNDSSTTYAYDRAVVWPRSPYPPDMDFVHAFDNSLVVSADRKSDGKTLPLPTISLHQNAVWIDYEPQFGNPVIKRAGDK